MHGNIDEVGIPISDVEFESRNGNVFVDGGAINTNRVNVESGIGVADASAVVAVTCCTNPPAAVDKVHVIVTTCNPSTIPVTSPVNVNVAVELMSSSPS